MIDAVAQAVLVVVFAAVPGMMAFAGVRFMAARMPEAIIGGTLLVLFAGVLPLAFAYAWPAGVAGAAIGSMVAAVRYGRRVDWPRRILPLAAVLIVIVEPALVLNVSQVREDETYSRCAADKAVAVVEQSRIEGKGYPQDIHEIALADGAYGDKPCYVSNGVNWLYRIDASGRYTLGYWVDWRVTRNVCLHTAGKQGWSCGFEAWGPFRPGEID